MPTDIENLVGMGFSEIRAQRALIKTNYKGVQVAMDWLFAHQDDPDIDDPLPESSSKQGHVLGKDSSAEQEQSVTVQSMKCEECGKQLRNADAATLHAARSGHTNFSESSEPLKALSPAELEEQAAKLRDRLKEVRQEKEEKERQELLEKERRRRVEGRNIGDMREKYQQEEMRRAAAERKREKAEEIAHREKLRLQIEQDKLERASARGEAQTAAVTSSAGNLVTSTATQSDSCRLQMRDPAAPQGSAQVQATFSSRELLSAARLYICQHLHVNPADYTFMTTFPRRVFSEEDMQTPLLALGLCPSANLLLKKK